MITNKHLKQLGFSKIGNSWVHWHTGIKFRGENRVGYWDLRWTIKQSSQTEMFRGECFENQQPTIWISLDGKEHKIIQLNGTQIAAARMFNFSSTESVVYQFAMLPDDSGVKQLKLDL